MRERRRHKPRADRKKVRRWEQAKTPGGEWRGSSSRTCRPEGGEGSEPMQMVIAAK